MINLLKDKLAKIKSLEYFNENSLRDLKSDIQDVIYLLETPDNIYSNNISYFNKYVRLLMSYDGRHGDSKKKKLFLEYKKEAVDDLERVIRKIESTGKN